MQNSQAVWKLSVFRGREGYYTNNIYILEFEKVSAICECKLLKFYSEIYFLFIHIYVCVL